MILLLYRVLYLPALLLALPYYLFRMWRRGGYGKRFGNRLGILGTIPEKRPGIQRIWIQAVSVGELLAIIPLLKLLDEEPGVEVILTTTTSTGYRLLEDKLASQTVWHGIFPIDFWYSSRRAWKRLQPDIAVLMEGELWPEHIHQAWARQVPVILVNARLSDRSFRRHYRMRRLVSPLLRKLSGIHAGSETDLKRFRKLGWLPENLVRFSGNLKLDLQVEQVLTDSERSALLKEMGFHRPEDPPEAPFVLLGSSTWPGEEAALVNAYRDLVSEFPGLRLLLVPRHAERRKELETVVQEAPFTFHFRSDRKQAPMGTQIYIADTTGELRMLTQVADLVVIGKSLPPNAGGQTPVESAALGKPLIFGPDMSNFRDISRRLVRSGAAIRIKEAPALSEAVRNLILDQESRLAMGRKAHDYIQANHGATRETCRVILEHLNRS